MNLKVFLKKSNILTKIYRLSRPLIVPSLMRINYRAATKLLYFETYGKLPNLNNPTKFSEKLASYSINNYNNDSLVIQCADKFHVREYIEKKGYGFILNELYGSWSNTADIEWENLPNSFVLKCNHGSGFNFICKTKDELDKNDLIKKINNWLATDYWKKSGEIFYKDMEKVIYCEKLIETKNGLPPKDFKIFCSYGVPKFMFVASERTSNENVKFDYYTPEWNKIPVKNVHENSEKDMPKPHNLAKLLEIASDLSTHWPQVRVDLHSEGDEIIFGELTFLHMAGRPQFTPREYDEIFGSYFP